MRGIKLQLDPEFSRPSTQVYQVWHPRTLMQRMIHAPLERRAMLIGLAHSITIFLMDHAC
jgi:hypothetical protein